MVRAEHGDIAWVAGPRRRVVRVIFGSAETGGTGPLPRPTSQGIMLTGRWGGGAGRCRFHDSDSNAGDRLWWCMTCLPRDHIIASARLGRRQAGESPNYVMCAAAIDRKSTRLNSSH